MTSVCMAKLLISLTIASFIVSALPAGNSEGYRSGNCSLNSSQSCHPKAECVDSTDGLFFTCKCQKGTQGDGFKAEVQGTGCNDAVHEETDAKSCTNDHDCLQHSVCNLTSFKCDCKQGFQGDGYNCTDIDECEYIKCDVNAVCRNIPGSYNCTCDDTRNFVWDGSACILFCYNDKDCDMPRAKCNTSNSCQCIRGYEGSGLNCTDIDECARKETNNCSLDADCLNINASFRCQCKNGFSGDGYKCTPIARKCDDIKDFVPGQKNEVDFDGPGPANAVQVTCTTVADSIVTVITPITEMPMAAPQDDSELKIGYGADPSDMAGLDANFVYCYQTISFSCYAGVALFPGTSWCGPSGVFRENWGSYSLRKCACGAVNSCTSSCYCDGNQTAAMVTDSGKIMDKRNLPVIKLRFRQPQKDKGRLVLGPVMCSDNPIDIPRDCHEAKFKFKITTSQPMYIDPDGRGGDKPFLVYCNMHSYAHLGITVIRPLRDVTSLTASDSEAVQYDVTMPFFQALIQRSRFCSQRVEFQCRNSMGASINVTSSNQRLNYFPGADEVPDSCACGTTRSCENSEDSCNCVRADGKLRKDFGSIINKDHLPVVAVSAVAAVAGVNGSRVFIVGVLQCGQEQFGIEPNCEKYRALGAKESHTYFIDPDGYGGVAPFNVECQMLVNPPKGITIIRPKTDIPVAVLSDKMTPEYLRASPAQIEALKKRSTICTQSISFYCYRISIPTKGDTLTWSGLDNVQHSVLDYLTSCGPARVKCKCRQVERRASDSGVINDIQKLPVYEMDFSAIRGPDNARGRLQVLLGSLVCAEVFPTCAIMKQQLSSNKAVKGEGPIVDGDYTVDPDGVGGVGEIAVRCRFPATIIDIENPIGGLVPNPDSLESLTSTCFNMKYTHSSGASVAPAQIDALVQKSGECTQHVVLECVNAPVSRMVNYTTCDGRPQKGWVGSFGEDKCPCGVNGNCAGGRFAACNCDLTDNKMRSDSGSLIKNASVCQICLAIAPVNSSTLTSPLLQFKVSELRCDADLGTEKNCQHARQKAGPSVKSFQETPTIVNKAKPVLVGCMFIPTPPLGYLVLKTLSPVTVSGSQGNSTISLSDGSRGNSGVPIDYITHNLEAVKGTFVDYKFCIQTVSIFNASLENLNISGEWGFYNNDGHKLADVQEGNETSKCYQKVKDEYSELLAKFGQPRIFIMTNKEELPVTRIVLSGFGFVLVVGDVVCVDVMTTCQEIMDKNSRSTGNIGGNHYVMDPDGPGDIEPFPVTCDFDDINHNAVTEVPLAMPWHTTVTVANKKRPAYFPVTYSGATHKQINTLAKISPFCWQAVSWQGKFSPLVSRNNPPLSFYNLYGYGPARSFGTGSNVNISGCACSMAGTCASSYSCNSDSLGPLTFDQGVVTYKDYLPITGVTVGGQMKPTSLAKIRLTAVRCSARSHDFPRDCSESSKIGHRFGYTSNYNGEFPLSPNPKAVDFFIAWCDFTMIPNTGVTVVKVADPVKVHLPRAAGSILRVKYHNVTLEQLKELVHESKYCYQGIKFQCSGSSSSQENITDSQSQTPLHFWGDGKPSANRPERSCLCGQESVCGGFDSSRGQRTRLCNCNARGNNTKSDAGIIDNKDLLPLDELVIGKNVPYEAADITVGDLLCAQKPIPMNACDLGFHECHPKAKCIHRGINYWCVCDQGWNGKGVVFNSWQPIANGRECIDDNECAGLNSCPYTATCINTPGSYYCTCKPGYRQTGLTSCEDINECANSSLSHCDGNAHCQNLDGSYRCICNRGFQGDGHTCTPVGECLCFGGSHCITYDGRWVDVQGVNEYVLSQDGCSLGQPRRFRIHIQTWKKDSTWPGQVSYIKSLIIYSLKNIKLDQGGRIIVDGSVVRNYKEKNYLTIRKVKGNIKVETVLGLTILWDGKDIVKLLIPKIFSNSMCGLCGNYNNNSEDDAVCGPGCPSTAGNLTKNDALFSESWIVSNSTGPINCSPDQPEKVDGMCYYPRRFVQAEINALASTKKSVFKECLKQKKLDHLKKLREKFENDLCHAEKDLDMEVCRLGEILAWDCLENENINIRNWSSHIRICEEKPSCPNNMVHRTSPEATFPVLTCDNLTEDIDENQECFCRQGEVLEGDRCIKPHECGCFYNSGYLATGDVNTQADCSKIECQGKNVTNRIPAKLDKNEECALVEGMVAIRCEKGYIKDENNKCIRDKCYGVKCSVTNMICINGTCVCKSGYINECDQCKDVDECVTGIAKCDMIGQTCINTEGSFACICEQGYRNSGSNCKDINECDYAVSSCGDNSECVNAPGTYQCECCAGFIKNNNGTCQRNESAGEVTKRCCACHGKKCTEYGVVCGTDGETYPSYRSLYVAACRANDNQLQVNYKGSCKETCQQVICNKQYSVCTEVGAIPQCKCPTCSNSTYTRRCEMVCASNKITYTTRCHMKAAICTADVENEVKVEAVGRPCLPKPEKNDTSWGSWSSCSEKCKPGIKTRSRTAYSNITRSYVQETESETCYGTCKRGPCYPKLCQGPGQVCVVNKNNTASCQCPTCENSKQEPVCGQYGNIVQTFSHECDLQKTACEKAESLYKVLEKRACETRPVDCDVARNFQVFTDENGCQSSDINFGKCDGGCDNVKGQCCIATELVKQSVSLICPSGLKVDKELSIITKCGCITPPVVKIN